MSLTLRYGTPPSDLPLPATVAAWFQLLTQYGVINGQDNLTGVTIGSSEPTVDQQDLAWLVRTALGRPIGFRAYNGDWTDLAHIVPSGAAADLPLDPQAGELFRRTDRGNAIEVYSDGAWMSAVPGRGVTADRPTSIPDGYRFYDTDIERELRWDDGNSGWTTMDGAVGDLHFSYGVSESTVLTRNPGWTVLTAAAGRVPYGADGTIATGATGGRASFNITTTRGIDPPDNGAGANYVTGLSVDGTAAVASAGLPGGDTSVDVPINPLAFGVIVIQKQF